MKTQKLFAAGLFLFFLATSLISAIIVDADYVTLYPGEEGRVTLNIENNENFDISDITFSLDLSDLPFTPVGSSAKDVDDIDEDDDDSVSFMLRPSTGITPGDYTIPYRIKYTDAANSSENFTKEGDFGLRVSAKTDLDFSVETSETAIIGREGQITLEIINKGLGEIKSVSVQILPSGFELLSGDKVFVGTIDAEDSDTASFDVIYKTANPTVQAKVTYKDFDNADKTETVNLLMKVYTEEQALNLGLISKSKTGTYITVILVLLVLWYFWRKIRKRRKQKQKEMMGR